jgi:hypothetical protein
MKILKDIPRDPTPDGQGSGTDGGVGNDAAMPVPVDSGSTDSTPTDADSTTTPS